MSLARAAALFAIDPAGLGGLLVRGRASPAREAFIAFALGLLPDGAPVRRVPVSISDDRLLGGLDLAGTLQAGRPVLTRGVLAEADGGALVLPMAERQAPETIARIAAAMDVGAVVAAREAADVFQPARFGVLALDESIEDEHVHPALTDRVGLHVACEEFDSPAETDRLRDSVAAARPRLAMVAVPDNLLSELVIAAEAFGLDSARPALLAVRVARANAALDGRSEAVADDAKIAAALVLAPRALRLPPVEQAPEEEQQTPSEQPQPPPDAGDQNTADAGAQPEGEERSLDDMREVVLDAVRAAIPQDLLAKIAEGLLNRRAGGPQGKGANGARSRQRGRPAGARAGELRSGARLALLDTLRAAAPWQAVRRKERALRGRTDDAPPILVRQEDFRIRVHKPRALVATIFVVDASGSAALHRLAEAKGAVLALLAQCYVRRDEVGLIAFRGTAAELLLAPTRSLTRVRRQLAQLPGGGGTPLASGIALARETAVQTAKKGARPVLVFLTDGAANVGLNGMGGRASADADVERASKTLKALGFSSMVVDTSARPGPQARKLAERLGARYMPLPLADAARLANAVRAHAG